MPVVGIVLDAVLHQFDGTARFTSPVGWRRSQKSRAKLVRRNHLGIESGRDLKQRSEFVIAARSVGVAIPKILHSARPVDAGHQAFEAQAGALHHFRRTDVESVLGIGPGPDLVYAVQEQNAGRHRHCQADCCNPCCAAPRSHRARLQVAFSPIISGSCAQRSERRRSRPSLSKTARTTSSAAPLGRQRSADALPH